jgi:hypothetical protein
MMMEFAIKISGLDGLAAAIDNLAEAMKAGAKTGEVIEKAQASAKGSRAKKDAGDPKPTSAEAADDKGSAPEATAVTAPVEETSTSASPSEQTPLTPEQQVEYYDRAKRLVVDLTNAKGRPVAAAILDQFGAKTLRDVAVVRLPELIAAAEKALA